MSWFELKKKEVGVVKAREQLKDRIFELRDGGYSVSEIAEDVGVSETTVRIFLKWYDNQKKEEVKSED